MIDRRTFLAGAAWCAVAGILRAQMNGTAPPGPSGLVQIKADRPTLLMGDEAAITGGAKPQIVDHGAKRLQVGNWTSADDSFTWQVDVPASGEFIVTALTKSKGAVLELKVEGKRLDRSVQTSWDRVEMGLLQLGKGVHKLTLRASQPGPNMEFYSVELITPELDYKLQLQAKEVRSDTSWMREAKYGLQFHWTSQSAPRHGFPGLPLRGRIRFPQALGWASRRWHGHLHRRAL
jgi:hypothetical protein